MKELETEYLIVGAGCSGLSFAQNLKNSEYIIVEKENEPGGYCRTIYKNGFVWDYAGHFFHFASEYWKEYFERRIKKEEIVSVKKNTKIYYKGKLIDYPFQKNIHQLEKEEFIECLFDLFFKTEKEEYNSFQEMLYGKFGKSISDKFLIPYNEKLYACDLNKLDCNAMGRFFPYANISEILLNMKNTDNMSYNDSFLYPKNGAKTFVDVLLSDVKHSNILYNEELIDMDKENHCAKTSNYIIKYKYLINTSPLNSFVKIVDKKYNKELLGCNKVLVFNLGFDKKSVKYNDVHWMYIPDKDINFYRVGFYDNILNQDRLSMYVEIGYEENSNIDIEKQLELTLKNLKKLGIIEDQILIESWHCIMNPAYVYISSEEKEYVHKKMEVYEKFDIYSVGRYGAWKYCSIEDCLIEATQLAKKLKII